MATQNGDDIGEAPRCAACKWQRKRCGPDCVLRWHFPKARHDEFRAVQKIFGIANVTRRMREANDPRDRFHVSKSLIWEAKIWDQDPVRGPYGRFTILLEEYRRLAGKMNELQWQHEMALQRINVLEEHLNEQNVNMASYPGNMMMGFSYNVQESPSVDGEFDPMAQQMEYGFSQNYVMSRMERRHQVVMDQSSGLCISAAQFPTGSGGFWDASNQYNSNQEENQGLVINEAAIYQQHSMDALNIQVVDVFPA